MITHYAYYHGIEGTAELVNGSGFLFRKEGERRAMLVSYTDPELVLAGRCDLAANPDKRPLWQQVADPATYEGTAVRTRRPSRCVSCGSIGCPGSGHCYGI